MSAVTDALSKLRKLAERWRRAIADRIVKSGDYHAGDGPESVPDCADELEALLPRSSKNGRSNLSANGRERSWDWVVERDRADALEQRERVGHARGTTRDAHFAGRPSWEQDNLGHDWKQACEVARAALNPRGENVTDALRSSK